MRNLLNPKWLFIINTLPIIILFLLFWGEYNIIKSLLTEENIILWKTFGSVLAILATLTLLYAVFLVVKKKEVSQLYGLFSLLIHIPFLYIYSNYSEGIIPANVPQWMVPGDTILYVGTFLMPTLAYSLFVLVLHLTPDDREQKSWLNFLIAVIIPASWYLFAQIILPFWKPVDSKFATHAVIIFIITGTLIFLFFLIRGIYILGLKKANVWQKYELVWKLPIALIFPLLGLAVNNGRLFDFSGGNHSGIFGDFYSPWFYILAIINGIFICLPKTDNKFYRLLLFMGRSITFAYTFYFFLVFLPFLPLSVIAIVAIGTGFLMLTPLVLFIIHANELSNDFGFLQNYFSKKVISIAAISGFLILPLLITATYLKDRSVLNEALDYLYTPDYSKNYKIDNSSLSKTLDVIKQHKNRNGDVIFGSKIPYLSSYFNWLVLDNLTLSDSKINTIENVFFDKVSFKIRSESIRNEGVRISKIKSTSKFDKNQNAWISSVDLEITNHSSNNWFSEYATTIDLPNGCWISDYYLYVGAKREIGILAEKKSAMWVFSQIRNENKDPGILYYLTGNKVAFRVFPFARDETRRTGIEFLHKDPVNLSIDGNIIELGSNDEPQEIAVSVSSNKNVLYISANEKAALKEVQRKPYYHFIVDVSKNKAEYKNDFTQRIETLLSKNFISSANAEISFTNAYTSTFPLKDNWKKKFNEQNYAGGFYLDRAIRKTLFHSYTTKNNSYPVIVTVTDSIKDAIIEKDFADFKVAFPETNFFYTLNSSGNLIPHSLLSNPTLQLTDSLELHLNHKVLAFPNELNPIAYVPNDNQPSIILKKPLFEVTESEIRDKNWQSALVMQGKWISQVFHPETSGKSWMQLVKCSFISKIMMPVTSYLVVENEAQKAILKRKQQQVLSSNKSLDVGEDAQRMTEPGTILLTILVALLLWFEGKRKLKSTE